MIIEAVVSGIVSNVISGIIKDYITRPVTKPLDRREIERIIEAYLAQHPGFTYTSVSLLPIVNSQLREVIDRLGTPTSRQLPAAKSPQGTTGQVQRFAGGGDGANLWDERNQVSIGVSVYSSKYGTYPVWGEIGKCYEHLGGTTSRLGFPTTIELPAAPSPRGTTGRAQRFEGNGDGANLWDEPNRVFIGVSIYSSKYGTYPVWGEIGKCYERLNGTTSRLGFPTSPELKTESSPASWIQHFEGGKISCAWGHSPIVYG